MTPLFSPTPPNPAVNSGAVDENELISKLRMLGKSCSIMEPAHELLIESANRWDADKMLIHELREANEKLFKDLENVRAQLKGTRETMFELMAGDD